MSERSVFRFSRWDLLGVATIPVHLAIQLLAAIYFDRLAWQWWLPAPLVLWALSVQNTGVTHNHYHTPIFRSRRLNGLATIAFSIAGMDGPKTPRNLSHGLHHETVLNLNHVRLRDLLNWQNPWRMLRSWGETYLSAVCVEYFVFWWLLDKPVAELSQRFDPVTAGVVDTLREDAPLLRNAKAQIVGVLLWHCLLCAVNYKFFLLCFMPSVCLVTYARTVENYFQHYRATDPSDPTRDSVSCYGRLYNLWTFNLGYHQEHHLRRGVHWLKLPAMRAKLPTDRATVPFAHHLNLPILFRITDEQRGPKPDTAEDENKFVLLVADKRVRDRMRQGA